jgi:hypothetical protein
MTHNKSKTSWLTEILTVQEGLQEGPNISKSNLEAEEQGSDGEYEMDGYDV